MTKIGIDIADTIIDVWPYLMKEAQIFNESHSNNIKSEESGLYLPEDIYGWNDEERKEFWLNVGQQITFSAPIRDGVQSTLEYLKKLEYMIYFVTAKSNDAYVNLEDNIVKMLEKNNIPYDGIYTQVNDKGKFCYAHDLEYLIDDSFNNCLGATNYGKTGILISNTYNREREMVENMYRVESFPEVKKYIKKIR